MHHREHRAGLECASPTRVGPEEIGNDTAPYQIQLSTNNYLGCSRGQTSFRPSVQCPQPAAAHRPWGSATEHPTSPQLLQAGGSQNTQLKQPKHTAMLHTAQGIHPQAGMSPGEGDFSWRNLHCPLQLSWPFTSLLSP